MFNEIFSYLLFQYTWRGNDGREHYYALSTCEYTKDPCLHCEEIVKRKTEVYDVTHDDKSQQHARQLAMEAHEGHQSLMMETYVFPGANVRTRRGYMVADDSI